MSDRAKLFITLLLSAIVVAGIYFWRLQPSGGMWIAVLYVLGGLVALNAVVGVFRGQIPTRRFGLVKRSESEGLFWFNVTLYFIVGALIIGITLMVDLIQRSGSSHVHLSLTV